MNSIFDRYYKRYDVWYDKNRFVYLSELEAIKKVLPREAKGLEIGVGTGRFASALGITMGIDPSKNMIEIARQRGVIARWGFGEDLPFWDSTFDYVAIIITLCFVKDPSKVLQETWRVLKNNGKIIIGIIDKDSFLGKFYQKKKSIFYKQANFFSVKELTDLIKSTGFNQFSYYQTLFNFPDKVKSVKKPLRGFGKGGFVVISAQKSDEVKSRIYRKFNQYEKIRLLFKKHGYDMEGERQKVLKRAGRIKEPILDVGTGPGRMAYVLARAGYKVSTIDISNEAQKVARIYARRYKVLGKIKFINMDAENMKFKDYSFTAVISANLLHDAEDPRQVVREIIRVTRPQGKIVISDLNRKGRKLVNKVYRINKEIHRSKAIDLKRVVEKEFRSRRIPFKKYNDGYITTYVAEKNKIIY